MLTLPRTSLNPAEIPSGKRRSESNVWVSESDPVKEFGLWLLWSGQKPESKLPVSAIGIYTDFT